MVYLLIILAILSAWEEVHQLTQRGSWKREDYRYPEWFTDVKGKWKNWDSHHVTFGLFVLVMFFAMSVGTIIWYLVPLYWGGFMYVRNIGLHIIFKKKPIYTYLYKFWR